MPEEVKNCKKLIIDVQKRVKQFRFIEQILVLEKSPKFACLKLYEPWCLLLFVSSLN